MKRLMYFLLVLLASAALPVPALAQQKEMARERQEYSEKDKQLLAEIAARPDIQEDVEITWDQRRRQDVLDAYETNVTSSEVYDNPIVADYVNSLGQRLVPGDSPNLYSFKIVNDPLPKAHALSTGTIYVSTGLVSMLDNEAQLAYILAHEVAHVERGHAYQIVRNDIVEQKFLEEKQTKARKKRAMFGALGTLAGGVLGGVLGGDTWAARGAALGAVAGYGTGVLASRNKARLTEWEMVYEDEADEVGLNLVLEQKYDAREVPKTYARLDTLVTRDSRLGLGFMSSKQRVQERTAHMQRLLSGAMKAKIDSLVASGGLVGGGPEFATVMASLKRDNGVLALEYDLFAMARENLQEATTLRPTDPRALYYLGKVVSMTARSPEERSEAANHFLAAIRNDAERGTYAEPHLQRAVVLIKEANPGLTREIQDALRNYVTIYQRTHEGHLPGNMHIVYDYLSLTGDSSSFVSPFSVVQTTGVAWPLVVPEPPAPPPAKTGVRARPVAAAAKAKP